MVNAALSISQGNECVLHVVVMRKITLMYKALIVLCMFLAGCSVTPRTEITEKPVAYAKKQNFDHSSYQEDTQITARAYTHVKVEGKKKLVATEVSGVPCRLSGAGYSSKFTTPSYIILPSFGATSKPVTVSCTLEGETVGVSKKPYNATVAALKAEAQATGNAVGGILGVFVSAFSADIKQKKRDPSKDKYAYLDVTVNFGIATKE